MWDELHRLLSESDLSAARQWLAACIARDRPVQTMIVAASSGGVGAVDLLCEYGWSVTSPTDLGFTPLMAAAELGRTDMVRHLSEADVDLDARDAHGLTALMYAAKGQYAETVEILLRAGASAEVKDNRRWSAGRHARWRGVGIRLGSFELNARIPCLRRTNTNRILEAWKRSS